MKNKFLVCGLMLTLFTLGTITSCKKESNVNQEEKVIKDVAYYSKKFMTDSTFATFLKTFVTNSFKINKIVGNDKNRAAFRTAEDVTDTSAAYDNVAEIVTAQVMLQNVHPQFFQLTLEEQQQVCTNVCQQLADENYRMQNPTNELVVYGNETIQYLNEFGPAMRTAVAMDITWGEFAMCTAGALGAALGEYGGIVGDVWRLFTQVSQYLSWGGVFQIASRVVRNAVPWYKVASVAFGYATCLWAAA